MDNYERESAYWEIPSFLHPSYLMVAFFCCGGGIFKIGGGICIWEVFFFTCYSAYPLFMGLDVD